MISGLLLLNKPKGITSHKLVQKVRFCLQQKSVGHCGTLDPMAEGLMLVVLGSACKLSSSLTSSDKMYEFTFQLGQVTDTLDITGNVIKTMKVEVHPSTIEKVLKKSLGLLELAVPSYSAVKYQGKKLYEYARSGKKVPVIKKPMHFYDLKILNIYKTEVTVQLSCKKGGYIRAWTAQVGEELGVGACLSRLNRLACLPFYLDQSLTLKDFEIKCQEDIERAIDFAQDEGAFIPVEQIQS
ncbi:MAG: tRNA pseudouridine(55) synthase TruB [Bdellovibrionales bacterium]|nr:tRNA pseudouridine(55) synthase TruB [Bdellovibrionales bacterium]